MSKPPPRSKSLFLCTAVPAASIRLVSIFVDSAEGLAGLQSLVEGVPLNIILPPLSGCPLMTKTLLHLFKPLNPFLSPICFTSSWIVSLNNQQLGTQRTFTVNFKGASPTALLPLTDEDVFKLMFSNYPTTCPLEKSSGNFSLQALSSAIMLVKPASPLWLHSP